MKPSIKTKDIKPAGHRVLVKPDEIEEVTEGGIILAQTDKSRKEDAQQSGTLVQVGPTAWKAFDEGEPWANVGDKVLFAKYGGYSVDLDGELHRIMNDEDITAVVG